MSRIIHEDIIIDILSCLPVKSLIRFKSVCRPWNSIISSSYFAKQHLTKGKRQNYMDRQRVLSSTCPPQTINIEVGEDRSAVGELNFPNPISRNPFNVRIIGSCNGLMCLVDEFTNMVLWNPSTRKTKELPKPDVSLKYDFISGVGYDVFCDDYKVILASCVDCVLIYTRKLNKWIDIQETGSISARIQGPGIYWNGALHWLGTQVTGQGKVFAIVTFDLTEEKFKQILPMPNDQFNANIVSLNLEVKKTTQTIYDFENKPYSYPVRIADLITQNQRYMIKSDAISVLILGLFGNSLCIFCEQIGSHFEAYIMNDCGPKQGTVTWIKEFSIPFYRIPGSSMKGLCITKKGEVVMDFDGWELAKYKPKDGSIKYIEIHNDWDSCESMTYVESLVPPGLDETSCKGYLQEKTSYL